MLNPKSNVQSTMKIRRKTSVKRKGAAAVEMAIVLPIFFIMVFGIIEFGRGMMALQIITNSAREGARACAVNPMTRSEVEAVCVDYAEACGITGISVTISPDPTLVIRGEPVEVKVDVDYTDIAWLPPFWNKNTVLSSASTMRKEREYN